VPEEKEEGRGGGSKPFKSTEKDDANANANANANSIDIPSEDLGVFSSAEGKGGGNEKVKSRDKGFRCPVCKQKLFSHHDIKAHLKSSHGRRK
jgi:hypothetical protein